VTPAAAECYPLAMPEQLTPSAEQAAAKEIESAVSASGSSFLAAMWFLPGQKRRAMYAVYSFCRAVDDIADEEGLPEEKRERLGRWREEIDALFSGRPQTPEGRALLSPVSHYELNKADFFAVIDGMEFDASDQVRIADQTELDLYCDRVACAVGRLANRVFGVPPEQGDPLAATLGRALQLTNILRDLVEDAERNRLYIPADLLAARGIRSVEDISSVLADSAFPSVCEELVKINKSYYDAALAILRTCERCRVRPPMIMMRVYRRLLDKLETRGWQGAYLGLRVRVSRPEKLWLALRYGIL